MAVAAHSKDNSFEGILKDPFASHKCQIHDDVCFHRLGYNVSTAKTIKSPLLTTFHNLQSASAESDTEHRDMFCIVHLSTWKTKF